MPDIANPYVGLRPYHTDENSIFFGRDTQTLELLKRLYDHKFVAVIGSSGCGKSSLLRAGLIPALKGGFLVDDSNKWMISIMKPGQTPLYNLSSAILEQIETGTKKTAVSDLRTKIEEEGIDAIIERVLPLRQNENFNFFLLVDQFEELFAFAKKKPDDPDKTLADSKNEAINLVNILLELSQQAIIPFYVVLTMRSDFIGDCSEYYGLPEAMNKSQYLVPRLNRQELKKVIEGPAKLSGKTFNPALTSKLLNSLGDVQDELPILQHTLMRMWEFDEEEDDKNKGKISFEDYEGVGGLEKALSNHAQKAFDDLLRDEKRIAKSLFKALTTIDDSNRKIRRQVRLSKLLEFTETSENKLLKIINCFNKGGRSFLVIENIGESDDKLIDISHESLIRQWTTLKEMVVREARDAKQYKALSVKQKQHRAGDRSLLAGVEYKRTQRWWDKFAPNGAWASQYDANFDNCKRFLKESKTKYVRSRLIKQGLTIGLPFLLLAAIAGYKQYTLQTERKINDNNLWYRANVTNEIQTYDEYLKAFPEGEESDAAKDSITKKFEQLWKTAKEINNRELYESYIVDAQAFGANNDETNEDQYSEYALHVEEASKKIDSFNNLINTNTTAMANDPTELGPWEVALAQNTVNGYMDYIANNVADDHYEEAVGRLKAVGKKGWLFCGRIINDDNTKIAKDRVFDLVDREPPLKVSRIDDMLRAGDIVRLRGIAHRKIRRSNNPKSPGIGIVQDNMKYYVNSVVENGAVFVEIIF